MTQTSCFGCRYFRITHQPARPYACTAFRFRSSRIPSLDVMASSGQPCRRRVETEAPKRSASQ